MKKCIVFAPIAEREVQFYLEFAEHSKKMNWPFEIQFISFFQGGNAELLDKGYKVWDIFDWSERVDQFQVGYDNLEEHFGIDNLHKLTLHEKLTFGITENQALYDKFYKYLNGLDLIMKQILQSFSKDTITVMQELGGFVAPLALLQVCLKQKIQHVFFEPSFFKGTMNFIENSFVSSFKPLSQIRKPPEGVAIAYLQEIRQQKQLVIPQKDQHHYQDMSFAKIFNSTNFAKLARKLKLKYISNQKQQYDHIFNHVVRSLRQLLNRRKSESLYSDLLPMDDFIYFPFHVQLDVQLTIRNPEYLNQVAFVGFVCSVLPKKYKLVVKEHPASIGGFDSFDLSRLIAQNDNLVLVRPMVNTYEILEKAKAVITINSKVGAEAAALGHHVAAMGHGFYWNSEIVHKLDSATALTKWLEDLSHGRIQMNSQGDIEKYFSEIHRQSHPFELYNFSEENLKGFFASVEAYLMRL